MQLLWRTHCVSSLIVFWFLQYVISSSHIVVSAENTKLTSENPCAGRLVLTTMPFHMVGIHFHKIKYWIVWKYERGLLDQCATLEERQFWSLAVFVRRFVWKVASTRFSLSHPPSTLTPIKKCINSPSPSTVLNPTLHVVRHCAFAAAKCGLTTDLTEAETRNLKPLCQTKPVALELCVQSV